MVGDSKVVVYSKANCPQCVKVKNDLMLRAIEFEEVRVDQNPEARQMLLDKGHRSVPVIYKNGEHVANHLTLTNEII